MYPFMYSLVILNFYSIIVYEYWRCRLLVHHPKIVWYRFLDGFNSSKTAKVNQTDFYVRSLNSVKNMVYHIITNNSKYIITHDWYGSLIILVLDPLVFVWDLMDTTFSVYEMGNQDKIEDLPSYSLLILLLMLTI